MRGLVLLLRRRCAMRIAQVAPLYESVPPRFYGGTERVVSYLTDELVRLGHEVTLFASGDSVTSTSSFPALPWHYGSIATCAILFRITYFSSIRCATVQTTLTFCISISITCIFQPSVQSPIEP